MKKRIKKKIINALHNPKQVTINRAVTLLKAAGHLGYDVHYFFCNRKHCRIIYSAEYAVFGNNLFKHCEDVHTEPASCSPKFNFTKRKIFSRYVVCMGNGAANKFNIFVYDIITKKVHCLYKDLYTTLVISIVGNANPSRKYNQWREINLPPDFEFHDDVYNEHPNYLNLDYNIVFSSLAPNVQIKTEIKTFPEVQKGEVDSNEC